mmetsp:Transcript_31248/g.101908  ORF Transcript_31248/g.101908 Transcript_31248/m.101908 type:complete len:540 (+) Transcript_31248:942-2561(+)
MAAAAQAFDAGEAVEARLFDAPEREALRHVRRGEVVHRRHACLEPQGEGARASLVAAEDVGPEPERAVVGAGDGFVVVRDASDAEDGAEHLLRSDAHVRSDAFDHGGRVKLTVAVVVAVEGTTDENLRTLGFGVVDQTLDAACLLRHAHRAAVDRGRASERRRLPELLRHRHKLGHEPVVDAGVDKEALRARAVLAAALEGAAQGGRDHLAEVRVVAHHKGVLAAELEDHGREVSGRRRHHFLPHHRRPDKDQFPHPRVRHERVPRLTKPCDDLDEVLRRVHRLERRAHRLRVKLNRPRRVLRHLHHERVPGKEVGQEGVEHVVERVVPRHDGAHDANRDVLHARLFVKHHRAGAAILRLEPALPLVHEPVDLLERHHHLAKAGVHHRLAAVARGNLADGVHILQDVPPHHREQSAPLLEGGARPSLLRLRRAAHALRHVSRVHRPRSAGPELLPRGRIPQRDPPLAHRPLEPLRRGPAVHPLLAGPPVLHLRRRHGLDPWDGGLEQGARERECGGERRCRERRLPRHSGHHPLLERSD